jgi:hypothetical protein
VDGTTDLKSRGILSIIFKRAAPDGAFRTDELSDGPDFTAL